MLTLSATVHQVYAIDHSDSILPYTKVQCPDSHRTKPLPPWPENETKPHRSARAPLFMSIGILCGILASTAHHMLNSHLHGRPVAQFDQTTQAWFSRIGVGLAFSVKVAFVVSVGIAYVQYLWLRIRQASYRIKDIDDLMNGLGDVFAFTNIKAWLRNPLLVIMALISW